MNQLISYAETIHCNYLLNEPMNRYTTMKIGGNADIILFPDSTQAVSGIVKECRKAGIPLTVVGNGSNLLVRDSGIRGAVLLLGSNFSDVCYLGNGVFSAQAGASLTKLCRCALAQSYTGLEFAFGIPGSVGGAAFMNAGAYGGEMKDVLYKCRHVTDKGELAELPVEQMDLSYRHSVYGNNHFIITEVFVKLKPGSHDVIQAKMEELMQRRKSKQPLEYPSAGSTFKRPEGYFAGTLIEACGLKGKQIGGAQVSEKHAGFLVNAGGATCRDVLELAAFVQQTVKEQKGVDLEMEIKVLG